MSAVFFILSFMMALTVAAFIPGVYFYGVIGAQFVTSMPIFLSPIMFTLRKYRLRHRLATFLAVLLVVEAVHIGIGIRMSSSLPVFRGMTFAEVQKILGPGANVGSPGGVARVSGYSYSSWKVSSRCECYRWSEGRILEAGILFVFYDNNYRVEHVFIGGS